MLGSILIFVLSAAAWITLRSTVVITEWQRRSMWIVTILLFAAPSMTPWANSPVLMSTIWPFALGAIVGERLWMRMIKDLPFLLPPGSLVVNTPKANKGNSVDEKAATKKKKKDKTPKSD